MSVTADDYAMEARRLTGKALSSLHGFSLEAGPEADQLDRTRGLIALVKQGSVSEEILRLCHLEAGAQLRNQISMGAVDPDLGAFFNALADYLDLVSRHATYVALANATRQPQGQSRRKRERRA
jgi:hypothetical protein